jgi:uncharacterized protein
MEIPDVLRGLALFGVLVANMLMFDGLVHLPAAEGRAMTRGSDGIALMAIDALFRRKSLTLLSFLFGLGFAVQIEHAQARGVSVVPTYLRRLSALFAIGAVHAVLLWWGDELTVYAISGIGLLLFRRASVRALLLWAAFLILVPRSLSMLPALSRLLEPAGEADAFAARMLSALRGHDPAELFRMQARQAIRAQWTFGGLHYLWTLGSFLVGYAAGRSRLFHGAEERLPFFRKLLGWGLGLGLVCTSVMVVRRALVRGGATVPPAITLALVVPEYIGIVAVVIAYVAATVLLMQRPAWKQRLMILAPAGQTALTCYVMQSLICAAIFYGWGLGLLGHVGPALCVPLSIAIFAAQIFAARLWLTRFRFGPLEWVWRSLTYGRQPILRRT